ncbi:hypothetical protein BEWA_047740 [Theileria equi strain WA]|uniref:Uncharacterized protein n=1 Tax=Theileria equi strain WA TaxID=1537102 RepID=L1LAN8_THEEQ|nr:hypothetical protein BEWA_047740 [Theileria equi strain WA]EKX72309.1 hypothetical protein BEWA_047740 [Theileria equi strain WA]|eukprot:XP_004831761.1 hypothetical protein BEWA_047740 [Theileria equi strain WA]
MNYRVRLDLDPSKNFPTRIERSENKDGKIEGYNSYKYTVKYDGSFNLSALLYNDELLPGLLSYDVSVRAVITYFKEKENKPLVVHLESNTTHTYYFNPDTISEPGDVIFTEFIVSGKALDTPELEKVLNNITRHSGFSITQLNATDGSLSKKLLGENDIMFDLTHRPNASYISELANVNVNVSRYGTIDGLYQEVRHSSDYNQFRVLGIKLPGGQYMEVKGGFPNDLITEFSVYYRNGNHDDPYLVTLKISFVGSNIIPSRYYLTKSDNEGTEQWDIRRVSLHLDNSEILHILRDISLNGKLQLQAHGDESIKKKLYDIRNGLPIDLTQTTGGSPGQTKYYVSKDVLIPYMIMQDESNKYRFIRHANVPSFTLKSVKTNSGEIDTKQLPPSGTLLGSFNVYYKNLEDKDPVLIELVCIYNTTNTLAYAYYYCKEEGKWQGYVLSTTVENSRTDMLNVIKHVSKNDNKIVPSKLGQSLENKLVKYPDSVPKVILDISKPDGTAYTPEGDNATEFIIRKSHVGSNFHKFRQIAQNSVGFRVETVIHDQRSLSIKTSYSITSLSAYYFGRSLSYDDLILVQLGEDKKYYQWNAGDIWSTIKESGEVEDTLKKEVCRKKGHILDISKTDNETYPCLGCGNTIKLESTENSGDKFTKYKHYLSPGKLSISGLLNKTAPQSDLPSAKDLSAVYVYWYPNGSSATPLLVFYDCTTDTEDKWFKKTGNDTWQEVTRDDPNKPTSEEEKKKIQKLLLDSNSPFVVINLKNTDEYDDPGGSRNKIKVTAENFEADKGETREQGQEGVEYKKYTHKVKDKAHFKLNYLRHGGNILNDIKPTEVLAELSAYYWVGDAAFDKPLVVMLKEEKASNTEYMYYERSKSTDRTWQKISETQRGGKAQEMRPQELKKLLDRLKAEYFPPSKIKEIVGGTIGGAIGTGALGFGGYKLWPVLTTLF